MSAYLLIPEIEVRNANAQPVWWMIGPPPITAYLGFARALCLHLGDGAKMDGLAIVHHDIQFLGEEFTRISKSGHLFYEDFRPHQFRAASFIDEKKDYSSTNKHALSSQPTARCHIKVSLVIRFDEESKFLSNTLESGFLRGGRIAGGQIVRHGAHRIFVGHDALAKVRRSIGPGWLIVERQDLMKKEESDRDMLDVLIRQTVLFKTKEERQKNPWLLPTNLGFIQISERKNRKNVRDGLPHAYAEPLVGIVQYKSLGDKNLGLEFWRYQTPTSRVFVASTE